MYDADRKTPVAYAIEECHFEVVQVMRDHIYGHKMQKKKKEQQLLPTNDNRNGQTVSKNLLQVVKDVQNEVANVTPKKLYYNNDVTSPYYVNITHRRGRPQPKYRPEGHGNIFPEATGLEDLEDDVSFIFNIKQSAFEIMVQKLISAIKQYWF